MGFSRCYSISNTSIHRLPHCVLRQRPLLLDGLNDESRITTTDVDKLTLHQAPFDLVCAPESQLILPDNLGYRKVLILTEPIQLSGRTEQIGRLA